MKTKIDSLGRIAILKKIRSLLRWEKNEPLDILLNTANGEMTLKKTEKACICCGGKKDLFLLKNEIYLCSACAERKKKTAEE